MTFDIIKRQKTENGSCYNFIFNMLALQSQETEVISTSARHSPQTNLSRHKKDPVPHDMERGR